MTKSRLSLGYGPSRETGQETLARPGGAPNTRLVFPHGTVPSSGMVQKSRGYARKAEGKLLQSCGTLEIVLL